MTKSLLKAVALCFAGERSGFHFSFFKKDIIFHTFLMQGFISILLMGEFATFWRTICNGDKPLHLAEIGLMIAFVLAVQIIAIFISMRYKIYGWLIIRAIILWPGTIFLLPSFIIKHEQTRKLEIIRDVMES